MFVTWKEGRKEGRGVPLRRTKPRSLTLRETKPRSCRSLWPRGLMRRSAAARLPRLLVRIPPGHGCLPVVSVVCCQVEVSATS
jgi:hypothetical protein